jgi:membrane-associated phospholipid phosphatase
VTTVPAARPSVAPTRSRRSWRVPSIVAVLIGYVATTVLVVVPDSPLLRFDAYCMELHLWHYHPAWHPWLDGYVILGQRGPATLAFLPFFVWVAWRQRSTRPLVLLVTALIWLNLSVGVVKYAFGRVGPMGNNDVHRIFEMGANIYPSGHVANAVVLYGLIAWVAPKYRRALTVAAVVVSVTVGLATVYLRTHWFSDVVGGWLAGGLVLLTLPYLMPTAQRWADRLVAAARSWWLRRRAARRPVAAHTVAARRAPVRIGYPPAGVQSTVTPVSSSASVHSRLATSASLDALDERTRCG